MAFHNAPDGAQSFEMGKDFVRVCSAVSGAVNSHRSEKMLIFITHLLWRASYNSRVQLQSGNHGECMV